MTKQQTKIMRQACQVILQATTEIVLEKAKNDYRSDLESWEIFEARKRVKMKQSIRVLENRVIAGFESLLKLEEEG